MMCMCVYVYVFVYICVFLRVFNTCLCICASELGYVLIPVNVHKIRHMCSLNLDLSGY